MAFEILGRAQGSEVQGGNTVVTVFTYNVISNPSGTYFQFRRPLAKSSPANIKNVAKQFSDRIEAVAKDSRITDVQYFQDTTQGGLLRDMMRTYYSAADGTIMGSVESDLAHFGPGFTLNQVQNEIAAGGDYLGS